MKNKTIGGILILIGALVVAYGAGPALGLSGVGPVQCPTGINFYLLSQSGTIETSIIVGSAQLVGGPVAAQVAGVPTNQFTGLPATYYGTESSISYVGGTSSTNIIGDLEQHGAFYWSADSLGQYNADGSCTEPGGITMTSSSSSTTIIVITSTTTTGHPSSGPAPESYLILLGIILILTGTYVYTRKRNVVA